MTGYRLLAPERASLGKDEERTIMIPVLGWIAFGVIVGAVAKLLVPGRDPGGILITILGWRAVADTCSPYCWRRRP
jgi:hypothetical protein